MVNERRAPEIRFDGFTEIWERHGLTEVLSPTVGSNTLSRAELNYDDGEIKNIHYGDILIKFNSFVDAVIDEIPFITNGEIVDFKSNLLKDGDVIFADTAEDETTGKVIEITNSADVNIVSGLHTIVYRPKRKFANCFMGYYLNTNVYRQQLIPLMQGAKVLSLGRSHLATTLVRYPSTLSEQAIIADFFRNFDDAIALAKQQHKKTLNIKKAMLEKMFPKKGATVPEIRFDGFIEEWIVMQLDEAFKPSVPNNTLSRIELNYNTGEVKNIHYGDVLTKFGSVVDSSDMIIPFVTDGTVSEYRSYLLQDGDIVFADTAEDEMVGKAVEVINTNDHKIVSGLHTYVFRPQIQTSQCFFGYYFNSHSYRWQLLSLMQGVKVLSLNRSNLSKTLICFPPLLSEQAIIARFFRNLDDLINAQRQEIDKLQNIKNACLNKMFV